jgi:hypothetical protein
MASSQALELAQIGFWLGPSNSSTGCGNYLIQAGWHG